MLVKSIFSKDYSQNTPHMDTKLGAFHDPLLSIMRQWPSISGELKYERQNLNQRVRGNLEKIESVKQKKNSHTNNSFYCPQR